MKLFILSIVVLVMLGKFASADSIGGGSASAPLSSPERMGPEASGVITQDQKQKINNALSILASNSCKSKLSLGIFRLNQKQADGLINCIDEKLPPIGSGTSFNNADFDACTKAYSCSGNFVAAVAARSAQPPPIVIKGGEKNYEFADGQAVYFLGHGKTDIKDKLGQVFYVDKQSKCEDYCTAENCGCRLISSQDADPYYGMGGQSVFRRFFPLRADGYNGLSPVSDSGAAFIQIIDGLGGKPN